MLQDIDFKNPTTLNQTNSNDEKYYRGLHMLSSDILDINQVPGIIADIIGDYVYIDEDAKLFEKIFTELSNDDFIDTELVTSRVTEALNQTEIPGNTITSGWGLTSKDTIAREFIKRVT